MADETTKFESSQALFCAFVDLVGTTKAKKIFFEKGKFPGKMVYETFEDFEKDHSKNLTKAFKETDTPGMSLSSMKTFLMGSKPWFYSSVTIAIKLISDLHTYSAGGVSLNKFKGLGATGMQKIDYVRGDKEVMGNIELIWRICRDNQKLKSSIKGQKGLSSVPFLDVNKWSPADIYYSSPHAKKIIKEILLEAKDDSYEPTYYHHLNDMINDLMKSGDLLGVSLKKQPDPTKVKIKLVNFSDSIKKSNLDEIEYASNNASGTKLKTIKRDGKSGSVGKIKWKGGEVPANTNTPTRDFVVSIKGGGAIQMRHDPSGNAWKVDFKDKGAGARAGSVTAYHIFCDIWALVDSTVAEKFRTAMTSGRNAFDVATKNPKWKARENELKLIPFKGTKLSKPDRFKSSAYDFQKGELSAILLMNKILPILVSWFNKTDPKSKRKKNAFCQLLFQYVTSRHPDSGKFIIVK
tara:strand:+ start:1478 stop:2869 length:1392 start_codon:yes stop_codon:yes gene_type:complete